MIDCVLYGGKLVVAERIGNDYEEVDVAAALFRSDHYPVLTEE